LPPKLLVYYGILFPEKGPLLNCDIPNYFYPYSMWLTKPGEIEEAVETALRAGYRRFNCSPCYNNDREIGNVLQRWFKDGRLKREEVFITSKLP